MLVQALEYLFTAAHKARTANIVQIPGDGRVSYVELEGKITPYAVTPPLRNHTVESVEDLIAAANRWEGSPVIWVSESQVVLIPDDADRRERVTLPLHQTQQFQFLKSCDKFDQLEMIRAFRTALPGAEKRLELIAAIRSLKWRTSSEGTADIQHGKESLGRSVENEVTGQGSIPELVVVTGPVFRNPGEESNQCAVGCDLEIDAAKQRFIFKPLPDELAVATATAIKSIRDRIAASLSEVTVLYGKP